MSIQNVNGQEQLRATMAVAALRNAQASAPTATPATRAADAVTISPAARTLAAARKTIGEAGEVRDDRVSAIKAAIANGTYNVSSNTLARKLVRLSD